jgi:hypothetical protein
MIHIKHLVRYLMGANRDMERKAKTKPRGIANSSVSAKRLSVTPNPSHIS